MVGSQADRQPQCMGGSQGVVERNAMRYYLAIDLDLAANVASPPARFEQSLGLWFDASERVSCAPSAANTSSSEQHPERLFCAVISTEQTTAVEHKAKYIAHGLDTGLADFA